MLSLHLRISIEKVSQEYSQVAIHRAFSGTDIQRNRATITVVEPEKQHETCYHKSCCITIQIKIAILRDLTGFKRNSPENNSAVPHCDMLSTVRWEKGEYTCKWSYFFHPPSSKSKENVP